MSNSLKQTEQSKILVDVKDRILWTKKEASSMCGVSPTTFGDFVRKGLMPQPSHGKFYSAYDVRQASMKNNIGRPQEASMVYDAWDDANG